MWTLFLFTSAPVWEEINGGGGEEGGGEQSIRIVLLKL